MLHRNSVEKGLSPLLLFLFLTFLLQASLFAFDPILQNDGIMPPKEVDKIRQMGDELYKKTKVAVFVAAVDDLNASKPIRFIDRIKNEYPTYILLYMSKVPTTVNIFYSPNAKNLADYDQILSPLPWRGTIRPVMSPAFSKDEKAKFEVALLNGYADLTDQVAKAKGVTLKSSIGSGSKDSFLVVRWIFYAILLFIFLRFVYYRYVRK